MISLDVVITKTPNTLFHHKSHSSSTSSTYSRVSQQDIRVLLIMKPVLASLYHHKLNHISNSSSWCHNHNKLLNPSINTSSKLWWSRRRTSSTRVITMVICSHHSQASCRCHSFRTRIMVITRRHFNSLIIRSFKGTCNPNNNRVLFNKTRFNYKPRFRYILHSNQTR